MENNPLNRLKKAHKEKAAPPPSEPAKKKGRSEGKRSDPEWVMRSFFVRKQTDVKVKQALLALEARGIELDKSDLTEALLDAWLHWLDGGDIEALLNEVTPRKK